MHQQFNDEPVFDSMSSASSSEEQPAGDLPVEQSSPELDLSPAGADPRADTQDAWHSITDEEMMAAAERERKAAGIKHVWTSEDTYASLALKYYGSFKEPYWRLIYDHNKEIIGNHPNAIRVGLEIEIPPLPDELKLK